ncbi:MAG: FeoB-associated Cys-rich membrane protein [Spirochaetaceae bacterium]|nr:FeoB-associated Cys-rich membrane protein [Spirochaetaceae bacterium]
MNLQSWLVLGAVLACVIAAVLYIVRRKNKCTGCSGNCTECGSCRRLSGHLSVDRQTPGNDA